MKKLHVLLFLTMISVPAFGDEIVRGKGDKSLNFSFSGFNLDEYKYGIGGKYWVFESIAFTGSVNLQNSKQDQPISESESNAYGLSFGVEKHFKTRIKLSPYIGGELRYLQNDYDSNSDLAIEFDGSVKQYGVDMLVGVEYAIDKNISLAAEYAIGYTYSKNKTTSNGESGEFTNKNFGLGAGELILLFYF